MGRVGAALRARPLPPQADLPQAISAFNNLLATLRHDLGGQVLYQSVSTPAQLTASHNNYAIGSARVVRLSSDASRTITGFRGGLPNQELTLINVGSNNIVVAHQSASSDAANRVLLEAGANLTLAANDAVTLYYDQATARWRNYALPLSAFAGTLAYAQLPTGGGTWANGGALSITGGVTTVAGLTSSALVTAQAGLTVSGGAISASGIAATVSALTATTLTLTGIRVGVGSADAIGRIVDNGILALFGGASTGGRIYLYGETHATQAHDIELRDGVVGVTLAWDASAGSWSFQSLPVSMGALTAISGDITQTGSTAWTLTLDNSAASNRGSGIRFEQSNNARGAIGTRGLIEGNTNSDMGYFAETGLGHYWYVNGSGVAVAILEGTSYRPAAAGGLTLGELSTPLPWSHIISNGFLAIGDGITAPAATAGYAKIFVDSADGDLKIIYGDGTTKLIVVDT